MVASSTTLPVIGIPVALKVLDGMDSLLSIAQMPRGVPVATVAINNAVNAGLLAIRILATNSESLSEQLELYAITQMNSVVAKDISISSKYQCLQ